MRLVLACAEATGGKLVEPASRCDWPHSTQLCVTPSHAPEIVSAPPRDVERCALVRTIGRARLTTPPVQPRNFRSWRARVDEIGENK
jgi:hypothetical protein